MEVASAKEGRVWESTTVIAVAGVVAAVFLGWCYWAPLMSLVERWRGDDNYGHGWFVVPIALAILWQRRDMLAGFRSHPGILGFLPLIALLAFRYWLYERNELWIESATLPLTAAAFTFAVGGWGAIVWAWPALLFLCFMLPLPPSTNNVLAGSLQTIATIGSVNLLHAIGMAVINEGNVILVGGQKLEVAEACRGLSMLLSFATLITAMVILVKRPIWERLVLLASIIPIALACNIIRIAVTAICYAKFGGEVQVVHDWAGLAMMPLALGFVLIEMKVMSWLVVEVDVDEPRGFIRATYTHDPGPRIFTQDPGPRN